MLYQPGPKARAEYRAFTKRGGPVMLEVEPFHADPPPLLEGPPPSPLGAELTRRGVTPAAAAELVRTHGEADITRQIEHLDWLAEKKPEKIADPAGWLVSAIRNGHAVAKGFVPKAERQLRAEAKRRREDQEAEARRLERRNAAAERRERARIADFWEGLTKAEREQLDADAMARADPDTLALMKGPMRKFGLQILRDQHIRTRLLAEGKRLPRPE